MKNLRVGLLVAWFSGRVSKPLMLAFMVILAIPHFASAATFTVNSFIDARDASPGDGFCETAPGNGVCTLRAAIMEMNTNRLLPVPDTIILPAGLYKLNDSRYFSCRQHWGDR